MSEMDAAGEELARLIAKAPTHMVRPSDPISAMLEPGGCLLPAIRCQMQSGHGGQLTRELTVAKAVKQRYKLVGLVQSKR